MNLNTKIAKERKGGWGNDEGRMTNSAVGRSGVLRLFDVRHLLLLLFSVASNLSLWAAESTKAELDFFENKIRPLLVNKCYKCHSSKAEKLKGGLSLEFREAVLKGGESGPAVVPGNLEKSLLIKAVRYTDADLQMPPKGQKLTEAEIADLEKWVTMGAPDPRKAESSTATNWNKDKRDHWAFKPIKKTAPPEVSAKEWCQTPIDNFIAAKLEANGMKPAGVTDKRTLIRRATFDLIGLPPTEKEVDAFLADSSTNAFAKVVDRLLASPQYGERWGRFWLDVARYSDTKGDVNRQREDARNPMAWTYRDYVVRSFNEDKPMNRFIVEQIAADRISTGSKTNYPALGFLTLGDHFNNNINDRINDSIDVVAKGTMGLTVTCARCHDHKFDPISQKDYYALRGVFISSTVPEFGDIISKPSSGAEYNDYAKKFTALYSELDALDSAKRKSKEQREREGQLRRQITDLELEHPAAPMRAPVIFDRNRPMDSPVFIRGEADNRGEMVPRRFLELLSGTNYVFKNGSGRLELATAITNPKNPLTPRVMVNRVWLHHFGEGFVTTPDDFGNQSEPPSHPELLDYLSSWFIENGWSLKKLHRQIMLSSVYQESSGNNPRYAIKDPQNRLLWRANIRRLEFEAVRDSLLAIGGELNLAMGGKPVNLGEAPYSTRRTIYGYIDRRNLPEVYTQFDFANPDIETGKRYQTIVPQQALFMMNSPLVVELARNLVERSEFQNLADDEARVKMLYKAVYQREPTATEVKLAIQFIEASPEPERIQTARLSAEQLREKKRKEKRGRGAMSLANIPASELKPLGAWEKYAHALLQAN